MSSQEARSSGGGQTSTREREALSRLDEAVGGLLDELERLRKEHGEATSKAAELEELLANFVEGESEPGALVERVRELESENGDLRVRLEEGREGIRRMLARIRFLEEQA